jgi:hypothetical protein
MERRDSTQAQHHRQCLVEQQMRQRVARTYRCGMRKRDFGAPQIDREVGKIDVSQQKAVLIARGPHPRLSVRQAGLEQPVPRLARLAHGGVRWLHPDAQPPWKERREFPLRRFEFGERDVAINRQSVGNVMEPQRSPGTRL